MKELRENGFVELSAEETMGIDGGELGTLAGIAVGYLAGVVIDGTVKALTGQSTADWVADGIDYVVDLF